MNKLKLLCVIDSLGSGGAQRQLVSLSIEFKKAGHDVSFLVYHTENFFKNLLEDDQIQVHEIIEPSYIKRILKMRRFIREGNYHAVLSFLEAANFICEVAAMPSRKWKLVVGERSSNPNIFNSFKLRFYRWFHLFADFVVSNSNENMRMVKKINPLLPSSRCKVIYNLVNSNLWNFPNNYTPLKNGKLNLLVAASHQYLKNANGLIEAVYRLSEEEKAKIKIEWYGDEQPNNSLKEAMDLVQQYRLEKIFSFFAATKDIIQKMQEADAIGLFSFYEGLPNVICEGMSLGKVIISSNISDVPLLINNPNLLFNPVDTAQISKVLSYLISLKNDELIEIGEKNLSLSKALFQKDLIVKEYLELLNSNSFTNHL